ncbi:CopG family transcriptional regulator [Chromatium weissei]|nr:CopG family transcriptional regulator [Chromatium weissei]
MNSHAIRSTLYLDPALHQALCCKAANTHRSISEIVNDAIRLSLQEDEDDLVAFADRAEEPTLSYEAFLAQIKADGTL